MTTSCKQLAIDQAVPGMTLSEALLDVKGDVLLPQGTSLTSAIITSLQRRGIESLPIWHDVEKSTDADTLAEQARELERLSSLFRKCGNERGNGLLLQYLTQYRTGSAI